MKKIDLNNNDSESKTGQQEKAEKAVKVEETSLDEEQTDSNQEQIEKEEDSSKESEKDEGKERTDLAKNEKESAALNQKQTNANSESEKEQKKIDSGVDESTKIKENQKSEPTPLKELNLESSENNMKKKNKSIFIVLILAAILAGAATGVGAYRVYNQGSEETPVENIEEVSSSAIKEGDVFGIEEEKTFKDTAQGYLEAGGVDGEGSHKLLRPGGASQTVYLTSSVTDLDKLVEMEVKVWGETYKGQKAGWLMDVGKVEVLNPKAQPPEGEEL